MRRGTRFVAVVVCLSTLMPAPGRADTLLEQVLADPETTVATAEGNTGFELVGHSSLNHRGNNAALAVAGDCAYIGNRGYDREPVIMVDVADPSTPTVVGAVPGTGVTGRTTRELRTSPANHLLVVMTYSQSLGSRVGNELLLYDISDCRAPTLAGVLDLSAIRPHEFFLWEDPARPGRVLAYVTTPFGPPQMVVVDLSEVSAPSILTAWEGLYPQPLGAEAENSGIASYLHSLSISPDGRRGYVAYWDAGYYEIDTSQVADAIPAPVIVGAPLVQQAAGNGTGYTYRAPADDDPVKLLNRGNTHSAVPFADDRFVALTDEAYDAAGECPYGWFHLVDTGELRAQPRVVAEYRLEQNDPAWCDANRTRERDDDYIVSPYSTHDGTWSAHNFTLTENVAFVAWHAAGLQAIDTSNRDGADPDAPRLAQSGTWIPEPIERLSPFAPRQAELQQFLGNNPVLMWSYPVISDGLIYIVDIRNGLYVLRYTGPHASEVSQIGFLEGNSNVTSGEIVPAATAPAGPPQIVSARLLDPSYPVLKGRAQLACLLP